MISIPALFLLFDCIEPSGARITAGDLAPVVAELRQIPATTVLGYAPRPGVTRTFSGPELSRHSATPVGEPVCVRWPMAQPDAGVFQTAMQSELPTDAQLTVLEISQHPVPPGPVRFPRSGLRGATAVQGALWRGYVEYAPGLRFDIWARVNVTVALSQVVAVQDIPPGTLVDNSMVRLQSVMGSPGATAAASRIEDVIGRPSRRLLRAGVPIPSTALDRRTDVRKGDTLRVSVRVGSATIGVEATALAPAASGDTISARVNDTGRTVRVHVAGPGQASLQLSGAN